MHDFKNILLKSLATAVQFSAKLAKQEEQRKSDYNFKRNSLLFGYLINYFANADTSKADSSVTNLIKTIFYVGQWLWLGWQSGSFWYQRSAVRIQSLLCRTIVSLQLNWKDEKKEKEARHGPFLSYFILLVALIPNQFSCQYLLL